MNVHNSIRLGERMPKTKKCTFLDEAGRQPRCNGTKCDCPKSRNKCHVTATCWKVTV